MLERERREMGIVDQVAGSARGGEEPVENVEMTRRGLDERCARTLEPPAHNSDRILGCKRPREHGTVSGEAQEREQHDPREPDGLASAESGIEPIASLIVARRTLADCVQEDIGVDEEH